MMSDARIARIEWATLVGERPRAAGCNAHMQPLGKRIRAPVARVRLDDGSTGFGFSRLDQSAATSLVGSSLDDAFRPGAGVSDRFVPIECPIWDLVGRQTGRPVYELAAAVTGTQISGSQVRVRCYDTTLYIDDLDQADDQAGAALMAREAREGCDRGHRAFKIKVGRGNVHMPTVEGLRRDIAVVNAIRAAVGSDATVMADANNGYTFNIARDFLSGTADSNVFWLEEAFWEDPVTYRRLHAWIRAEGLSTRIGDGENRGVADPNAVAAQPAGGPVVSGRMAFSPLLLDMAREGIVDVVQCDIFDPGITWWLANGPRLHEWGRIGSPHHYGTHLGNYVSAHLGPALSNFGFAEWDEAETPGIAAPGYSVEDGHVRVPSSPGFGLELDEEILLRAVREGGFSVTA
jgi:L-rhamnonate dehydratase